MLMATNPLPTSLSGLTSQIISLNPEAKYTQRYLEQYFQFDLTSTPPSGLGVGRL